MVQPGASHSLTTKEVLPSASASVAEFKVEISQLHNFLRTTSELTCLPPRQLCVPFLKSLDYFTIGEAIILPILCSIVQAISAAGLAVGALWLQTCNLQLRLANSFPDGSDHTNQLNQIQSSLRDLSHRVANLPAPAAASPKVVHQQKKCLLWTDRHCVWTQEIYLQYHVRPASSQMALAEWLHPSPLGAIQP